GLRAHRVHAHPDQRVAWRFSVQLDVTLDRAATSSLRTAGCETCPASLQRRASGRAGYHEDTRGDVDDDARLHQHAPHSGFLGFAAPSLAFAACLLSGYQYFKWQFSQALSIASPASNRLCGFRSWVALRAGTAASCNACTKLIHA